MEIDEIIPKKILIVDDEPVNVALVKDYLRNTGYEIFFAEDGVEALKIVRARKIDAILLDKMMPNMDGIEFLNIIKQDKALGDIPVIMQTAAGSTKNMFEGYSAGAVYYLPKPFKQGILLEMLRKLFLEHDSADIPL